VHTYIYAYVTCICTWRLTELAIGAQRTAGEGRAVLGRPNPKSETIRDYNLNVALPRVVEHATLEAAACHRIRESEDVLAKILPLRLRDFLQIRALEHGLLQRVVPKEVVHHGQVLGCPWVDIVSAQVHHAYLLPHAAAAQGLHGPAVSYRSALASPNPNHSVPFRLGRDGPDVSTLSALANHNPSQSVALNVMRAALHSWAATQIAASHATAPLRTRQAPLTTRLRP